MKKIFLTVTQLVCLTPTLYLRGALAEDLAEPDTDMINVPTTRHLLRNSNMSDEDAKDSLPSVRELQRGKPKGRRPRVRTGFCSSDRDCDSMSALVTSYCASGRCLPMGSCKSTSDCSNPSNKFPVPACIGTNICSKDSRCVRECGGDGGGGDGGDGGGDGGDISDGLCASSKDCSGSQYCRRGVCAKMGECLSTADCFNRDNRFPTFLCVGPVTCKNNRCTKDCSGSFCPPEQPARMCMTSPCMLIGSSCSESISSCVDDYCGGCNAIAFDRAGNQVCKANV